jgi:hypothetical protein
MIISKPVDERLLYKIVGIERNHLQKKAKEIKQNSAPKNEKCIDLAYLESRTKSNPTLMMEMICLLQQTRPLVTATRKLVKQRLGITSSLST